METRFTTFMGKKIDFENIKESDIEIEDIAQSLSMQCRFNGHIKKFYSVAEHSYYLSFLFGEDKKLALAALLHDASEAYIADIPAPFKATGTMYHYRYLEKHVTETIFKRFGLEYKEVPEEVIIKDKALLKNESLELMQYPFCDKTHYDWSIECYPPEIAKILFLSRYYALSGIPAPSELVGKLSIMYMQLQLGDL